MHRSGYVAANRTADARARRAAPKWTLYRSGGVHDRADIVHRRLDRLAPRAGGQRVPSPACRASGPARCWPAPRRDGQQRLLPCRQQVARDAAHEDDVHRTVADDHVGDSDIAAARVRDVWGSHARSVAHREARDSTLSLLPPSRVRRHGWPARRASGAQEQQARAHPIPVSDEPSRMRPGPWDTERCRPLDARAAYASIRPSSVAFEMRWRVRWSFSGAISSVPTLTLAEASATDPLLEIVAPDPAQQARVAPWFFGFPVSYGLRYGRVWANEDASAVAVWIHPESGSMSMPRLLRRACGRCLSS